MKILVAGGAGFIGSHLVDELIQQGHHVDAMDNFITGQKNNLSHLEDHPNFRCIRQDIVSKVPEQNYQRIYNLASPASPVDFEKIPIQILMTGSMGHKNLLDLAVKTKARILFASTSEIYGDPLVNPQPESYFGNVNSTGPRACYDEAKRFGEALTSCYRRQKDVQTRIVRIFNTYGPRMSLNDGRVIPNFFTEALHGRGLPIYGDGKQTRSLCYISDMVSGIIELMESDVSNPVNIGGSQEMSVLEIGQRINKLTDNKADFVYHKLPQDDPKQRRPDTTLAKKLLNWSAKVPPTEGLKKTMVYFQKLIEKNDPL